MRVIRKYNQMRRDCWVDLRCENCEHQSTDKGAYDDRYYWDNVIPAKKCPNCGKSSNDLGNEKQVIETKYPEGMRV